MIPTDNLHGNPAYGMDQSTNRILLGTGGLQYDAAGNLTLVPDGLGGNTVYAYNPLGQVMNVNAGATASYLYNGSDQRVENMLGRL
jgi:YD repeat-containing protein